jgi:hypothetical protein
MTRHRTPHYECRPGRVEYIPTGSRRMRRIYFNAPMTGFTDLNFPTFKASG